MRPMVQAIKNWLWASILQVVKKNKNIRKQRLASMPKEKKKKKIANWESTGLTNLTAWYQVALRRRSIIISRRCCFFSPPFPLVKAWVDCTSLRASIFLLGLFGSRRWKPLVSLRWIKYNTFVILPPHPPHQKHSIRPQELWRESRERQGVHTNGLSRVASVSFFFFLESHVKYHLIGTTPPLPHPLQQQARADGYLC